MIPAGGVAKKQTVAHGAKKGIEHEDVRVYFNSVDALEPFDREVCGPAAVRSADA